MTLPLAELNTTSLPQNTQMRPIDEGGVQAKTKSHTLNEGFLVGFHNKKPPNGSVSKYTVYF